MQNLVISLKTAIDRRKHIEEQFESKNIAFQFFDALTPDLARPLAEKMKLNISNEYLSPGELACFMSHVSIWQKIVDENTPYLAIFEDDIFLGEQAEEFLNTASWIDDNWHILKIEAFSKKIIINKRVRKLKNGRSLFTLGCSHVGAAGYILSQKGARYLTSLLQNIEIVEPLDHILFDPKYHPESMELVQMMPALCIQGYLYKVNDPLFGSSLEAQRVNRRLKESKKRTLINKIFRELNRIFNKLTLLFSNKKDMTFR